MLAMNFSFNSVPDETPACTGGWGRGQDFKSACAPVGKRLDWARVRTSCDPLMPAPASPLSPLEFEQHRPYLLRFALLQLRDRSAADDAVQETFLAAIQGADRFGGQSAVRTWLIGILKHKIIDQMRKAAREPRVEPGGDETRTDDLEAFFAEDGHFLEPPGEWDSPEKSLEERRFFEALERCLEGLPKNTARAFMMRDR